MGNQRTRSKKTQPEAWSIERRIVSKAKYTRENSLEKHILVDGVQICVGTATNEDFDIFVWNILEQCYASPQLQSAELHNCMQDAYNRRLAALDWSVLEDRCYALCELAMLDSERRTLVLYKNTAPVRILED